MVAELCSVVEMYQNAGRHYCSTGISLAFVRIPRLLFSA
jgi:hypothetical protein